MKAAGDARTNKKWAALLLRSSARPAFLFVGLAVLGYSAFSESGQVPDTADTMNKIIRYTDSSDLADPITALQKKLDAGKVRLDFDPELGYLPAVMKAMKIPVSSQTLVFSKTSSQADFTSPETPRAVYFNDSVYLGFAHGSPNLDVISIDPNKGAVFFTIDQFEQARPVFNRRDECFNCHWGPKTLDVPGLFLRSITTQKDGTPVGQANDFVVGHNSPLSIRWGGWYVTGTHGEDQHLGNVFLGRVNDFEKLQLKETSNITDLSPLMETERYPTPHSDAVALLVLDHSTRMQNYIIQANFESRMALYDKAHLTDPTRDWSEKRIAQAGEALVAYMLFRDEGKLHGPIVGTSGYQEDFEKLGPFDSKGRSLRQFDLNTRVFKYPCSFLIYSDSFNTMPQIAKEYVWKRLDAILTGKDRKGLYTSLNDEECTAVREILLETKPEFRAWCEKTGSLGS